VAEAAQRRGAVTDLGVFQGSAARLYRADEIALVTLERQRDPFLVLLEISDAARLDLEPGEVGIDLALAADKTNTGAVGLVDEPHAAGLAVMYFEVEQHVPKAVGTGISRRLSTSTGPERSVPFAHCTIWFR
jgi:hypothetical protein